MIVLAGSSHPKLAHAIAEQLQTKPCDVQLERFPDGEIEIELRAEVRNEHVFIVQSLHAPVGEHLLELTLLADACHRKGASRVTAVVPYLGYARQDRREKGCEPLGARVVAELLSAGRVNGLICLDLHSRAVEGCFLQPVDHVTAVPTLSAAVGPVTGPAVVLSPDLGAVKRAEAYAKVLKLPVAVVHKQRLSGADVAARGVVGDVKGKKVVVVDDILSTGGTMAAAISAVLDAGALPGVTVVATHGLFVGSAVERLKALPIERVVVSDSLPHTPLPLPVTEVTVAPQLAAAIKTLFSLEGAPR